MMRIIREIERMQQGWSLGRVTLGDFFHQLVELLCGIEVSDGHVPKDFPAGKFRHVRLVEFGCLSRPQDSAWPVDNLFDVALRR